MKQFLVIGDIIGSTGYETKKLWKVFNGAIKKANKNFKTLYPFQITLGDEFQAVVLTKEEAKEAVKFIPNKKDRGHR